MKFVVHLHNAQVARSHQTIIVYGALYPWSVGNIYIVRPLPRFIGNQVPTYLVYSPMLQEQKAVVGAEVMLRQLPLQKLHVGLMALSRTS